MPLGLRLRHALYERLVFRRIRARLFGLRLRHLISGGAPLSQEIAELFHALGVTILEGYGLTETSAPATVNRADAIRFGTVGTPLRDVEVRIARDGEILIRGPGNFEEYHRDPDATREAFDEEGFFRTGDVGELDEDGFLRVTDRKKDIVVTAGGKNVAPQNIEALIKNDSRIGQAVVFGDRKPFLVALITLDPEEAAPWAARLGVGIDALTGAPEVLEAIAATVEKANSKLAQYETVKKWRLLTGDFTIENGMLTPTLKPKRKVIAARFESELSALYD
jgi:long-chain acyl-CoA synthetase